MNKANGRMLRDGMQRFELQDWWSVLGRPDTVLACRIQLLGHPWKGHLRPLNGQPIGASNDQCILTSCIFVPKIYGFNVGMQISTGDGSCPAFSCGQLWNNCPVSGPDVGGWASCFSGCCSSAAACSNGALPAGGGGCVNNAGTGPHTNFFDAGCPNAYAFPDNDGADCDMATVGLRGD
jgi:hypothetical protein